MCLLKSKLSLRASDYHIYISTASIPNCPQKLLQDEVSAPSALAAFEKKLSVSGEILFLVGLMQHFRS